MSAIAAAIDRLFADPNLARDALYRPGNAGKGIPVRVIAKRLDEIVGVGETRIHAATTMFDVRVSEVAEPRPGDRFSVEDLDYLVQGGPVRDAERLIWTLEAISA